MKIWQVGAELLHAGGRTEKYDESNSHFPQFCGKAPQNPQLSTQVGIVMDGMNNLFFFKKSVR